MRRSSDARVIGAVLRTIGGENRDRALRGGRPARRTPQALAGHGAGLPPNTALSCMGYEIAGSLGAKMAHPDKDVIVMVGDGSYMMLNSELATSVMLD